LDILWTFITCTTKINAGQKDSHLRTAQKSTPTTPTTPTTTGSAVFNFARFHALGAFDWHHIATGFNIRALYTGRGKLQWTQWTRLYA
jgi:hypothetical protein